MEQRVVKKPVQKRWLTGNWQRLFRGPYKKADSTDAFGDSWRGPYQPDTADGQTTSPQPPSFTLPRTLDNISSSTSPTQGPSSGQPQTVDPSQSAPAAMEQASAPGQSQDQHGVQELPPPLYPAEVSGSTIHQVQPHPLPLQSNSEMSPVPSPSTDVLPTLSPPADMTTSSQYPEGEEHCTASETDAESFEVLNSSMTSQPEELSPIQPMEQETIESLTANSTEACQSAASQPDSVEMESPTASKCEVTTERDHPEAERRSSSDSIPSLAAALMELHELLVTNSCAQSQSRSTSCSPSHPFRQDADELVTEPRTPTPEDSQPTPSTAITITSVAEPSNAKANHAAAVCDEGPSKCLVSDLSGQDEYLGRNEAETVKEQGPPQHPDGSGERGADRSGINEVGNISISQPERGAPPDPAADLELREPPEGQQGTLAAEGQASCTNSPDTLGPKTDQTFLSPLSITAGSSEEVSSTTSSCGPPLAQAAQTSSTAPHHASPNPFTEPFPAEHIQRIQAAGFSAREAAEALEQAHGVVELALLALLARSIIVPT
ncbi:protein DDI1 homolog 2 isoform X1 [Platichthys flesus]|uniref:protein DDI1 homolog 2 isoform X1 n=1 Tax=Platichthys flesus TaxID=8260 RepID=UPI002DBF6D9F|nr:protein DDI1 homolog 2 isoform X1 [Platichthys flesus]